MEKWKSRGALGESISNQASPAKAHSSNNIIVKDEDFTKDNQVAFEKKVVRGFDKNGELVQKEVIIKRTRNSKSDISQSSSFDKDTQLRHYQSHDNRIEQHRAKIPDTQSPNHQNKQDQIYGNEDGIEIFVKKPAKEFNYDVYFKRVEENYKKHDEFRKRNLECKVKANQRNNISRGKEDLNSSVTSFKSQKSPYRRYFGDDDVKVKDKAANPLFPRLQNKPSTKHANQPSAKNQQAIQLPKVSNGGRMSYQGPVQPEIGQYRANTRQKLGSFSSARNVGDGVRTSEQTLFKELSHLRQDLDNFAKPSDFNIDLNIHAIEDDQLQEGMNIFHQHSFKKIQPQFTVTNNLGKSKDTTTFEEDLEAISKIEYNKYMKQKLTSTFSLLEQKRLQMEQLLGSQNFMYLHEKVRQHIEEKGYGHPNDGNSLQTAYIKDLEGRIIPEDLKQGIEDLITIEINLELRDR